jgi:hypothetical protein
MYNSISCALGHHLAEGRWLRNEKQYLDPYVRFWFTADNGRPEPKFHNYSSWLAAALLERCFVSGDRSFLLELLDELIQDYRRWEAERLLPNGLFWQYDVRDGMEESISGSRTHRNFRPTINSYMYGNALALAQIATWAGRSDVAHKFLDKAQTLKRLVLENLWDPQAQFFKAQTQENGLCDAREAIGFIPWCFRLPDPHRGYEEAACRSAGVLGAMRNHHRRAATSPLPLARRGTLRMGRRGLAICHVPDPQRPGQCAAILPSAARDETALPPGDAGIRPFAPVRWQAVHRGIS